MKAWLLHQPGWWRELTLGEIPAPEPGPGEIRVAVHAVGLNPVDYKIAVTGLPYWQYPFVLGLDVAGVIDRVGAKVSEWKPGDRVFYHGNLARHGGYAEYAVTTAHTVAGIPRQLSFIDAASLPCSGLTAYHSLHRRLHVRAGQTILIQAGAGGVGGFAIQLAKHAGLKVLTTCSAGNIPYVGSLGAERPIDYTSEDVVEATRAATGGRGVDAILESLESDIATRDLGLLAFNGGMACLVGLPDVSRLQAFTVSPSIHEVFVGGAHLFGDRLAQEDMKIMAEHLVALIVEGAVRSLPVSTIPFEGIPEGLDALAGGHVRGKIVASLVPR